LNRYLAGHVGHQNHPKWKSQAPDTEVYALRLSRDGLLLAAGLLMGEIAIQSAATRRISYSVTHSSVRFLAQAIRSFLTISTDGLIREWDRQPPEVTWTHHEEANELYALDYHASGADTNVRVYDWTKNGRERVRAAEVRPDHG
jgi:hypothetical protein